MNTLKDTWTQVLVIGSSDIDDDIAAGVAFVMRYGTADCGRFELSLREMIDEAMQRGYQAGAHEVFARIERVREYKYEVRLEFPAKPGRIRGPIRPMCRRTSNSGTVHLSIARMYADFYELKSDRITARFTILPLEKEFQVTDSATGKRITPAGDLIAPFAEKFKRRLLELVNEGSVDLLIDFRNVAVIDSRCLGVLIAVNKALKESRSDAILRAEHINPKIMELLRLTCLTQVLSIPDSEG
jgi:anti-anti-sigma regulatory factor